MHVPLKLVDRGSTSMRVIAYVHMTSIMVPHVLVIIECRYCEKRSLILNIHFFTSSLA